MPAKSEKQRKFIGAELSRKREGKKTKIGMSEKQLSEFASKSILDGKLHSQPDLNSLLGRLDSVITKMIKSEKIKKGESKRYGSYGYSSSDVQNDSVRNYPSHRKEQDISSTVSPEVSRHDAGKTSSSLRNVPYNLGSKSRKLIDPEQTRYKSSSERLSIKSLVKAIDRFISKQEIDPDEEAIRQHNPHMTFFGGTPPEVRDEWHRIHDKWLKRNPGGIVFPEKLKQQLKNDPYLTSNPDALDYRKLKYNE